MQPGWDLLGRTVRLNYRTGTFHRLNLTVEDFHLNSRRVAISHDEIRFWTLMHDSSFGRENGRAYRPREKLAPNKNIYTIPIKNRPQKLLKKKTSTATNTFINIITSYVDTPNR